MIVAPAFLLDVNESYKPMMIIITILSSKYLQKSEYSDIILIMIPTSCFDEGLFNGGFASILF
jgi:hypothetical protein